MAKQKVSAQFYRQPRYYNSFSCIGGSCPASCCIGWRVDWTKEEVEKLKNSECSENLRKLIDSSFEEIGEKYEIKLYERKCPFLTEDNFCFIQREIGEEYLSYTCRNYPRSFTLSGNTVLSCCNISCYHVMDILCSDKDCMVLENYKSTSKKIEKVEVNSKTDIMNHPELKYRQQLFEFLYELISDDSHSLETSIVLGALAAQGLTRIIEKGEYDSIPDYIKNIKGQLNDPEQIKKLESFKSKPEVRLGFAIRLNQLLLKSNLHENIIVNGEISLEKFLKGDKRFNDDFSNKPYALRNIALNLLLELHMPFRDKKSSLFDNYCYFAAAVAAIKFAAACVYADNDAPNPDRGFKVLSAFVSRQFAHNNANVELVIKLLKIFHCTSPAYLALIVK